jgi:hypothetical protein
LKRVNHTAFSQWSTVMMKDRYQAPSQGAKAASLEADPLVDRPEITPLVDGAPRRARGNDEHITMTGITAAVGEEGILAKSPVAGSRLAEPTAEGARGSTRRRLLAAVRAWATAGQLGPDRNTIVGRYTGARC